MMAVLFILAAVALGGGGGKSRPFATGLPGAPKPPVAKLLWHDKKAGTKTTGEHIFETVSSIDAELVADLEQWVVSTTVYRPGGSGKSIATFRVIRRDDGGQELGLVRIPGGGSGGALWYAFESDGRVYLEHRFWPGAWSADTWWRRA